MVSNVIFVNIEKNKFYIKYKMVLLLNKKSYWLRFSHATNFD